VGTPAFLAPEVARGGDPSPASDMWSLGATLYSALEGRPPFGSGVDNPLAVLARIGSEPVPPASSAGGLTPVLPPCLVPAAPRAPGGPGPRPAPPGGTRGGPPPAGPARGGAHPPPSIRPTPAGRGAAPLALAGARHRGRGRDRRGWRRRRRGSALVVVLAR